MFQFPSLKFRAGACRPARVILATTALSALAACTSMQSIPPGTPLAEVQARYGTPTLECPLGDSRRNLVWSTQPMGHFAWSTQVGPEGTVSQLTQVLSDAEFRKVETGRWNSEQLRCAFGPPAEISSVGLPSVRQTVWSYRYLEAGVWYSLMHFYISDTGIVERMHPGPDPMYEVRDWPLF